MVDQTETMRHIQPPHIDTNAIVSRLAVLADVALCPECEPTVTEMVADIVDLTAEVTRLYGAVIEARRESANRLAAIRAALGAASEGEADPLGFLRDELAESPGVALPVPARGWGR